jgi:hypothetical protein
MKLIVLAFIAFTTSFSFAQSRLVNKTSVKQKKVQESKTTFEQTFKKPNDSITKGIRAGLTKPFYNASVDVGGKAGTGTFSDSSSPDVNYTNGLKVGYAYLPVGTLGYIADFDYLEVNIEGRSTNIVRLDGNAAFAFTPMINLHMGINYARNVGKGASLWDPGYGAQFGVGFQFARNLGFELNYSESKMSAEQPLPEFGKNSFATLDVKIRGFDMNLIGTF